MTKSTDIVSRVDQFLSTHLAEEKHRWNEELPAVEALSLMAEEYVLAGGKRLRTQFCYWAFVASGGDSQSPEIVHACSALELLHAFALVHDDIMDGAQLRRDNKTPQLFLQELHQAKKWKGEPRRYGEGVAILLGDLLFAYAQILAAELNEQARETWASLNTEVAMGQYLDIQSAAMGEFSSDIALAVARYKSGKYSVERPLQLGAATANALGKFGNSWSEFGVPLGEAFQLRDDLLGVFGDQEQTGKPVGDDLREGKATMLISFAKQNANAKQKKVLDRIGNRDLNSKEVAEIIDVLGKTSAINYVESEIEKRVAQAQSVLLQMPIDETAKEALKQLALASTSRSS